MVESNYQKDLDQLFSFVPPNDLRKSVIKVFFPSLSNFDVLPDDFQKASEDIQHLIEFLDKAEEQQKK